MAPMSRGTKSASKVDKQKYRKSGTDTTRNYRFQSFSQRISNLKIDPVRQARQDLSYLESSSSHFIAALEEWKDLNLSENFTDFSRQVSPLSQSMPMLLLNKQQIVGLLVQFLEKEDALSLEPLLSLVVHFAHDLGTRFEEFFEKTVATISRLAAKHPDIEVIEWSFNSLAWLFKYLSRLLVLNLGPLYNLLAPLLGKTSQKSFVTRFAAEALSYLIKKAGAAYHKDRNPLELIVKHAISDLMSTADASGTVQAQYQYGLVVLFSDSIKGIQNGVNANGAVVFKALLKYLFGCSAEACPDQQLKAQQEVVENVLLDVLHNTDQEGFQPIFKVLLDETRRETVVANQEPLRMAAHLWMVVVATRKGSRITDWSAVLNRLQEYMAVIEETPYPKDWSFVSSVLSTLAVVITYAPLEVLLPYSSGIISKLTEAPWDSHFLAFSMFVAEAGEERFNSLLLNDVQK